MKYTHTRISTAHKERLRKLAKRKKKSMLRTLHELIDNSNILYSIKGPSTNLVETIAEMDKAEKEIAKKIVAPPQPETSPPAGKIPSFEEFCSASSLPAERLKPIWERKYGKNN